MIEITTSQSVLPPETLEFRDMVEIAMMDMVESGEFEVQDAPVQHIFTEGLYTRQITMSTNQRILSKIHKTNHPFVISKGKCIVWTFTEDGVKQQILEAPYTGVTEVGTLRVLQIVDETIWTTFHPNPNNETVEEIEERIIEKRENKLISSHRDLIMQIMGEGNIALTD